MILVRWPWDETSGSPGLPFDVNWSQSFPGLCKGQVEFNDVCIHMAFYAYLTIDYWCREKPEG